jgi:transcriptional regulator with XRE-family HTH domain
MTSEPPGKIDVGAVLTSLRKATKHTQETLADAVGTSQSTITDLEKNKRDLRRVGAPVVLKLAGEYGVTMLELQEKTGVDLGQFPDGPPQALEYNPDGVYIRLRGLVSGGNAEPEELEGDLFFVPRHILKKYGVRNAEKELSGYMVNGNSMFYASDSVRARGLKNGDLIAVHRFLAPTAETPMVVAWDHQEGKMLVKLMDEGEDWIVFRSVNSSAHPPITRRKDEVHVYGTVIMRITAEP